MPELDAGALIEKHRGRGVLVDSNLLVLFFVGLANRRRIRDFKQTQNFTVDDFDLLTRLVTLFGKIIATPHVLAQVSDLAVLPGKELRTVRELFRTTVHEIDESYDPSRVLVESPLFSRLGLTDAAIASVCSRGVLVLTADVELHLALQRLGADALNFNHVRQLAWS